MRVLIISGEAGAEQLATVLTAEGFKPTLVDEGEEALDLAKLFEYEVALLDREHLVDGFDPLAKMRASAIKLPVIILSRDEAVASKVAAFTAGADDYLCKPFHRDELLARIRALARRSCGVVTDAIKVGDRLEVDTAKKVVRVDGQVLSLTGKEYGIVECLALRKNATQTKDSIMNYCYGGMDEPELKIIDVFVCKVRAKLRKAGVPGYISTIWGRGYMLRDDPDAAPLRDNQARPERMKAPKATVRGRVLMALQDNGEMDIHRLAKTVSMPETTLRATLSRMMQIGYAVNNNAGRRGLAEYAATGAGLAWLGAAA